VLGLSVDGESPSGGAPSFLRSSLDGPLAAEEFLGGGLLG